MNLEQAILRSLLCLAAGTIFGPLLIGCATQRAVAAPPISGCGPSVAAFKGKPVINRIYLCQLQATPTNESMLLCVDIPEAAQEAPHEL